MPVNRFARATRALCLLVVGSASPAWGWNAHGHRTITLLALDGLKAETPAWLRQPEIAARIASQSNEPDRWRGTRRPSINHDANTEHYLDVEDLERYGLSLPNLPRLRYEYIKAMVMADPDRAIKYDTAKDPDRAQEWPGFLAHAIDEHYDKLRASFNTLRILEAINDPAREFARLQARENVIYEMGILSHLVGDATQPLHTTRHHHGWVGPNPNGYTTDRGFHAYIDGRILEIHALGYEALKGKVTFDREINSSEPWRDFIELLDRSFAQVEPLYILKRDGTLEQDPGKEFITERLTDGASMLAALYNGAWDLSRPSDSDITNFIKYDPLVAAPQPAAVPPPAPATEPVKQ